MLCLGAGLKLEYIRTTWGACQKCRFFELLFFHLSTSPIPTRVLFSRLGIGSKNLLKEEIPGSYWKHCSRGWEGDQFQGYLRKPSLFPVAMFVAFWTTILCTFCFNLNRISNGEALFQNQSWQDFGMENFSYFTAAEEISVCLSGSDLLEQSYCTDENNRITESKFDAVLWGKQIAGNSTDQMETVLS